VRLLLDSHAVLWALYEPNELSANVRTLLADKANELVVSHITVLEIVNKASVHRLPMAGSSVLRIIEQISALGVAFLPLTLADITNAAELPHHHDDPFDRILVAQAQTHSLHLVSKDRRMPLYDVDIIWR